MDYADLFLKVDLLWKDFSLVCPLGLTKIGSSAILKGLYSTDSQSLIGFLSELEFSSSSYNLTSVEYLFGLKNYLRDF